jgi:DNA polymerase-3 subunit gamma/tau
MQPGKRTRQSPGAARPHAVSRPAAWPSARRGPAPRGLLFACDFLLPAACRHPPGLIVHVALARKYRPRLFGDLIGQEHVARGLRGAVEQNRVAHGYLLCGPRGVGKTTAARILAMALNCETRHAGKKTSEPGEPCGSCTSCERIWAGSASLDVVEIDAASNRGVDDARDLRERAMYAASQEGRHKIYIVDEAHMLTREAWNTLLKVLEEPPPGVVFVFATTEPNKITNTAAPVMSRLQRFDFRRVGPQAIADRLVAVAKAEQLVIEPDALALIARVAKGGLRDALSVLDQVTAFGTGAVTLVRLREVLGLVGDEVFADLLGIVAERRAADVFPFVARLVEGGVDLVAFAEGAADLWRSALAIRLGAKPDGVSAALASEIERRAESLAPGDLLRILRSLEESEEAITRGQSPRLVLEALVVRWALMDRTVEIAELLGKDVRGEKRDERGERKSEAREGTSARAGGATPASAPPMVRDSAPAPAKAFTAPLSSLASPLTDLSMQSVRNAWPALIDTLRGDRKMMIAETLGDAEIESVQGRVVVLKPLGANALTGEMIGRYRAAIETAAGRVLGSPVQVALVGEELPGGGARGQGANRSEPSAGAVAPGPRPGAADAKPAQRVTVSGAKAERTKALRGKDPALDSAMDSMDLELLE